MYIHNHISISLDLSKSTRDLLAKAQETIKARFPSDENNQNLFAFADVNCNLSVKLPSNKFAFFRCEAELDRILANIN